MLRIFLLGVLMIVALRSNAQEKVNDFKYVIVPKTYGFFSEPDKYQLNSLTAFLFKKYGFNAFMEGEPFPEDFNGCNALRANLVRKPGMFLTKLIVQLRDCNDRVMYTSPEGKSREKEYKNAYHEALRNAFKSVQGLNYAYSGYHDGDKKMDKAAAQTTKTTTTDAGQKEQSPTVMDTPEKPVSKPATATTYSLNEVLYILKKQEYGYELLEKETSVALGKLFTSSNGQNYIVKAGDLSGTGYFDGYGNFILERINPATNKIITDTLARQ